MDAAGRYSHDKRSPLVFAGVAVKTSVVDSIREAFLVSTHQCAKKWSEISSPDEAQAVFRFMAKHQLYAFINVIWKTGVAWEKYFSDGQALYARAVLKAQEPMPYAKPMNTFKTHMFGMLGSGLLGMYMGRNLNRLSRKRKQIRSIQITQVLDTDIQGETNQELCREVFAGIEGDLPITIGATGIKPIFKVLLKSEQEEPLLLLADHVAGYFYSQKAYGESEENIQTPILRAAKEGLLKIPDRCMMIVEDEFREEYILPPYTFDHIIPLRQRLALRKRLGTKSTAQQGGRSDLVAE